MPVHIQPATAHNRQDTHFLSHHPSVRKVLKAGADKLWCPQEIADIIQVDVRVAQCLLERGTIASTCSPGRGKGLKKRRRCTSASLLLYILSNSQEVPEAEIIASLGLICAQLPDRHLQALSDHCLATIKRRQGRAILSLRPAALPAHQPDLFATA